MSMIRSLLSSVAVFLLATFVVVLSAAAQSSGTSSSSDKDKDKKETTSTSESRPTPPAYANILKEAKAPTSGMWTMHQKGNNLYWEIGTSDYSSEYIVLIAI